MSKYPVDGWEPMPPNAKFDDLVHYNTVNHIFLEISLD